MTTTHTYVAINSPSLTLYFDIDEHRLHEKVQFTSANFITEDDEVAEILDAAIKRKPNLARQIRKIDKANAEKIALAHMAKMKSANPAGIKGGMDSSNANLTGAAQLAERDAILNTVDPADKAEQLPNESLVLTEAGTGKGTPEQAKTAAVVDEVQKITLGKLNLPAAK